MRSHGKTGAALACLAALGGLLAVGHAQPPGSGPAYITLRVPTGAQVFFDGDPTSQTGAERTFTSPVLEAGKNYHYDILARWTEGGRVVERKRQVLVTAGARVRVDLADKAAEAGPAKEQQVVTSKGTKRTPATAVNFKKALHLPFDSLGTLGARIEAARRKPDPVALAHAASELHVAEKVSGKKASLTSKAVLAEAAELARLRRQVAELKAVAAVDQQVSAEAAKVLFWKDQIALSEATAKRDREAVLSKELPKAGPRKILLNNYTTQYIDVYVNGSYKVQVLPGGSTWCVIEHKWDPTVLTAYGDEDELNWGPRMIYGTFETYTWNLTWGGASAPPDT
jgi:uncharacterized protein (TIGR03000 family)